MSRFDVVVESSKVGVRKPEPAFYTMACELLGVEPGECVFLDDLGINLKPAREMGMKTIKVGDPAAAINDLSTVLGIKLTDWRTCRSRRSEARSRPAAPAPPGASAAASIETCRP